MARAHGLRRLRLMAGQSNDCGVQTDPLRRRQRLSLQEKGLPETGLHTGVWVRPGDWIRNRGYTQVFEYAQAFGSPSGATYRRLRPQPGYTQVPLAGLLQGPVTNWIYPDPQPVVSGLPDTGLITKISKAICESLP